jgi:hypothetical protein
VLCGGARQEHAGILYPLISLIVIILTTAAVIMVSQVARQLSAVSALRPCCDHARVRTPPASGGRRRQPG